MLNYGWNIIGDTFMKPVPWTDRRRVERISVNVLIGMDYAAASKDEGERIVGW